MKRLIILAGAITLLAGTTLFANNMESGERMKENNSYSTHFSHMGDGGRHCNGHRGGRHYIKNKEVQANQIKIDEKRIELKKEMMKDTPDWNKVEKLNKEIGAIRAENKTIMMKERMSNKNN